MSADPAGALAGYLNSKVGSDVSGRIYRPELPEAQNASMPRAALVIRRAGGYGLFGATNPPVGDPTLDVFCYGGTWLEADNIGLSVVVALRQLRAVTYSGTRLMWARIAGGPNPFEDPNTRWPCVVVSAQVAHNELAVA